MPGVPASETRAIRWPSFELDQQGLLLLLLISFEIARQGFVDVVVFEEKARVPSVLCGDEVHLV